MHAPHIQCERGQFGCYGHKDDQMLRRYCSEVDRAAAWRELELLHEVCLRLCHGKADRDSTMTRALETVGISSMLRYLGIQHMYLQEKGKRDWKMAGHVNQPPTARISASTKFHHY